MTRSISRRTDLALAGVLVAAGLGIAIAPLAALVVVLAVVAAATVLVLPRRLLPAAALVAFALLPVKQLPVPGEPATINPGLLIVLVWAVRQYVESRRAATDGTGSRALVTIVAALGAWIAISALHSDDLYDSAAWSFSFGVLGLLPILLFLRQPGAARRVANVWAWTGGALGVYALVESLVLKRNPLFDRFYQSSRPPLLQVWSVYRVTTTLGHPLTNALFFALAATIAYGLWYVGRQRGALVCAVLATAGVLCSGSRSGLAAVVLGIVAVSITGALPSSSSPRRRPLFVAFGGLVVASVIVGLSAGQIAERNRSTEGRVSSSYRAETIREGLRLVRTAPVFGVGSGLADLHKRDTAMGTRREVGLENSWVELLAALGIPGFALVLLLWFGAFRTALRRADAPYVAGALVVYVVMAGSFNLLEAHRPAHLLFGLVLGLAFARPSGHTEPDAPEAADVADVPDVALVSTGATATA